MKQQIPINALSGNVAPTITSHYHKAGWSDLRPRGTIGGHKPEIAILEIEMEEPKVIQIANLIPEQEGKFSNPQRGRVYDVDGISPCIDNMGGGNREPKIIQIGSYVPTSKCAGKIVDAEGIAPTVMENHGSVTAVAEPAILTPIRTEEQRQLRKQGIDTFGGRQMLPRTDGVSNTITTVQKDNLLKEPIKIRQATAQGYIECPPGGGFDAAYPNSKLRRGRVQDNGDVVGAITASGDEHCVYEGAEVIGSMQANAMRGSVDGVSPCLTEAMGMGGGQIPMVTEPSILGYTRDDKGGIQNYHERDVAGTIHASSGSGGNTDQFVKEPCGCYDNQFGEFAREPLEGLSRTVKTDGHNAVMLKYRIRKLTPTECFRLMGCDDSDIDKLKSAKLTQTLKGGKVKEKPMPKTQLYKMAGNSIVVDVLYHIFHQMFIAEPPEPQSRQLTLFD